MDRTDTWAASLGVTPMEKLPPDLLRRSARFGEGCPEIGWDLPFAAYCTRKRGHTGRHHAAGIEGRILAVWP